MIGTAWLGLCALIWFGVLVGVMRWGTDFRLTERTSDTPVRVCVPARNEARNARALVEHVLASRHPALELVVADDHSTDETARVALSAGSDDDRFTLRAVPDRPEGWSGKAWACQMAAVGTRSPWLLFLDADVRVSPDFLGRLVAAAEQEQADLVSVLGSWELRGVAETAVVPAIGWMIRAAADPTAVNRGERFFANGQALLVRREAWSALGGHEVVAGTVLDDVRLAEAFGRAGHRVRLFWAPDGFRVRLYDGLLEVFSGYRKNLYEGLGRRPAVALVGALILLAVGVVPVLAPLWWTSPLQQVLAGLATALLVFTRLRIEWLDGRSGLVAPLHPLGLLFLVVVLLASAFGGASTWKGRRFEDGRAAS